MSQGGVSQGGVSQGPCASRRSASGAASPSTSTAPASPRWESRSPTSTATACPDVFTTNFANEPNTLHVSKRGRLHDDASRRVRARHGRDSLRRLGVRLSRPRSRRGRGPLDRQRPRLPRGDPAHDAVGVRPAAASPAPRRAALHARHRGRGGTVARRRRCDRAAVFGDLDGDGDVDVITAGLAEPLRVLRNDGAPGHWLIVEPAESPWGCRVEITAESEPGGAGSSAAPATSRRAPPLSRTSAWVRVTPPSTFAWSGPTEPSARAMAAPSTVTCALRGDEVSALCSSDNATVRP